MSVAALKPFVYFIALLILAGVPLAAQSGTNSGTIAGLVTDPTGAVVPNAPITISNPITRYSRTTTSDSGGHYQFANLPLNSYRITIAVPGFGPFTTDVQIRSAVAVNLTNVLTVASSSTEVTVDATTLMADDTGLRTSIDHSDFDKIPGESVSSGLSSLITATTPGIAADSNGQLHGLGDHASNTFSIDGEQISDQQSKVFSNQLPSNAVQSIQVIEGAPPAEYGGKTSLIIQVTTRSGLGVTTPTGSITTSYGSFGAATGSIDLSYGGKKSGNFFEFDGLNTGRFLDSPEFTVFHDKGNEQNVFDRIDRQFNQADSVHLDLNYSRSWFQTPNAFDNVNVQNVLSGGSSANPVFGNVGNTDQRSKIETFNIAPTYTHVLNQYSVFNMGPYIRKDKYNYFPSGNALADLGPSNLQTSSIFQDRTLTDAGVHADLSYVRGINNVKLGGNYSQTFLRENDLLGIVDSTYNAPCVDFFGNPLPGYSGTSQCVGLNSPNPSFNPILARYDLTRSGSSYYYFGHTDVKELALYIQDQIKTGNWLFNVGLRGDLYNGLAIARQVEPRLGLSYTIKRTGTVLRPHPGVALQREPRSLQPGLRQPGPQPAPRLLPRRLRHPPARLPQRVSRGTRAEPGQGSRPERRLYLEIHPQRLRLLRPRQHPHHLPHRLA
jgi:hypothetical protein